MTSQTDRLNTVAIAILELTYSEMIELGQSLADVIAASFPEGIDTDEPTEWASLLHAWAESRSAP